MDNDEIRNAFQAFRKLQPHPLRTVRKEFEVARLYKADHLMNIGLGKIDALKVGFTKSFLKENEKETSKKRQIAIMKAEMMIKQSKNFQKHIEEREERLENLNAKENKDRRSSPKLNASVEAPRFGRPARSHSSDR
jgi:hypothetical protein